MKKLFVNVMCSWICFWLAFYPAISYSQETEAPPATQQPTPLTTGERAPFSGVLIPTLQAAEMTARLEQQESLCNLRVQSEVESALSQQKLLLDNCNLYRQTYDQMYTTQITSQREYIDFLENRATGPKIPQEVVFIIGIVAGVGITIGAGYALNAAAN